MPAELAAVSSRNLVIAGTVFFPSVYCIFSFVLRDCLGLKSLTVYRDVSARLTSTVQAILSSVAGYLVVTSCYHNFIYATSWVVDFYMCFGVPYMIYDMWAMYKTFQADFHAAKKKSKISGRRSTLFLSFLQKDKLLLFHHTMVAAVAFPIAMFFRNGKGDFVIGCMFLTELSTPFVNLRIILKRIDRRDGLLFRINDCFVLVVFLLCRILIFPAIFWIFTWEKDLSWYHVPMVIPWHCTLGCGIIIFFQLMWYIFFVRSTWRWYHRQRAPQLPDMNNGYYSQTHKLK